MPFGAWFQRDRTRPEDDNPCKKVCALDLETRLCLGCKRRPQEIANWSRMTRKERVAVLRDLPLR